MHVRIASVGRFTAWLVATLLVVVPASPAAGQQSDQNVEFQSFRIPGWSFTPSIAAGVIHDSNVALSAGRASSGDAPGATLFNILPGGQLDFLGKRTDFSASYRGFLRRYTDVEGLDSFSQHASVGFRHTWSRRLTFFARNNYVDSPTTDEVDLNGVPFRRTGAQRNTFAAGAAYRITKFTSLATRYDLTWVNFERPDVFLTGGYMHSLRNELSHQLSERVSLGGEYSYRTASLDEGARELAFQDFGGVIRFAFGPRTSASAAGGYAVLHDRTAEVMRTGPYVRLGVTHALERATVGASFERQYVPSFGFGGATASQDLRGSIMMPLGRSRIYTQASGGWRRSIPFDEQSLELDTLVLNSIVGFAAARWARVEGFYTYARQDSIVTGGEVDRHRVGVQIVVSQPVRIR